MLVIVSCNCLLVTAVTLLMPQVIGLHYSTMPLGQGTAVVEHDSLSLNSLPTKHSSAYAQAQSCSLSYYLDQGLKPRLAVLTLLCNTVCCITAQASKTNEDDAQPSQHNIPNQEREGYLVGLCYVPYSNSSHQDIWFNHVCAQIIAQLNSKPPNTAVISCCILVQLCRRKSQLKVP